MMFSKLLFVMGNFGFFLGTQAHALRLSDLESRPVQEDCSSAALLSFHSPEKFILNQLAETPRHETAGHLWFLKKGKAGAEEGDFAQVAYKDFEHERAGLQKNYDRSSKNLPFHVSFRPNVNVPLGSRLENIDIGDLRVSPCGIEEYRYITNRRFLLGDVYDPASYCAKNYPDRYFLCLIDRRLSRSDEGAATHFEKFLSYMSEGAHVAHLDDQSLELAYDSKTYSYTAQIRMVRVGEETREEDFAWQDGETCGVEYPYDPMGQCPQYPDQRMCLYERRQEKLLVATAVAVHTYRPTSIEVWHRGGLQTKAIEGVWPESTKKNFAVRTQFGEPSVRDTRFEYQRLCTPCTETARGPVSNCP